VVCIKDGAIQGTVGDSYDIPMAEALWALKQKKLSYRTGFNTREEARTAIFDLIHWHSKTRRHWRFGYVSPIDVRMRG
jgi:transposase InsO family protein